MNATPDTNRKTAKLASLLFVVVCAPAASWGLRYVPSKIFVRQDAAATANNLLSNEFLYRTGIASHFISTIAFVFMALMFYRIFLPVDKHLSRIMVIPVLVQVPIVFVVELFRITALLILKGEALMTLSIAQKQEFSYLLMRMHGYGIATSQLFWGLYFLPFGMLVYRSSFVPKIIGVFLMITGIGYFGDTMAFLLLQRTEYLMVRPFIMCTFISWGLAGLWFLIKGVRQQKVPLTNDRQSFSKINSTL